MATVTIEAIRDGEHAERLVDALRRVASGNPFYRAGTGRWRVELSDSRSGAEARQAIEAELDGFPRAGDWRDSLRLTGSDVP